MKYEIKQGQEHKFAISNNILDQEDFLYPAFKQAIYALEKIVANAKNFDNKNSEDELYGYSQNIIAFSGVRGMGKTSAMISLSRAMKSGNLTEDLKSCRFEVLPPVDPTIMEKGQNIVMLLLSRMYKLAEDMWKNSNKTPYSSAYTTEGRKKDLLSLFNTCLASINAIKYDDTSSASNLSAISKISDSSILKRNLYELVQNILTFVNGVPHGNEFLVIQLDDTDTSTGNCYEILEDLRKFLSIPNVIILMATDMKLLRTVILQHYIDEFASSRRENTVSIAQIEKMESKYIDKIIPPTHAVHLPKLDESIVHYADALRLTYIDPSDNKNLLFVKQTDDSEEKYLSAQELILRYIYRKTGIVFVAPSSYYHNIIPTTLRGLSQFLALLSSMKDIPKIDPEKQDTFRNSVLQRVEIGETNIALFEKYFLNVWVEAKLSQKQADVISNIAGCVPSLRYSYIANSVASMYSISEAIAGSNGENHEDRKLGVEDLESFVNFMDKCEKEYRQPADIYFFFAIKTYLTILNHKVALLRMRTASETCKDKNLLIFDFSPDKTFFPDVFIVPNVQDDETNKGVIFYEIQRSNVSLPNVESPAILNNLFRNHYKGGRTKVKCFALMNLAVLALSFGDKDISEIFQPDDQSWLYNAQMEALNISINWDLHKKIATAIQNYQPTQYKLEFFERFEGFFDAIDDLLQKVNTKHPDAPKMLTCQLHDLLSHLTQNPEAPIKLIIGDITKDIEHKAKENFDCLCSLYQDAMNIESDLPTERFEIVYPRISELVVKANQHYGEVNSKQPLFGERFIKLCGSQENAINNFMNIFDIRFEKLCKALRVNTDEVRDAAKGNE